TGQQGLLHVSDGKTTRFAHGDGLSSDDVTALFEDREGSIWVGTTNGIDRFREPAVSAISANEGLSRQAWSVLATRDGSLWIGTEDGVNRWHQGQMTIYRSAAEPRTPFGGERKGALREITDAALPDSKIGSLFEDQRGRIWVTSRKGAAWFENGRFTRVGGSLPVGAASAILADQHEGVWITYPAYGLFHVVKGRVIESANWPWSDKNDPRVSVVISDPVKDGLWVGFKHEGIGYLTGRKSLANENGAGTERVWNLQIDHEGTLWAATEGGLSRIRDGRVATLTAKNGLPCDAVHWVIEDDAFSLWLYTACGLLRITRPDLDQWASDPKRAIHTIIFEASDGVRTHALLSPYSPIVTKAVDGKIWFAHLDGVSVIDPLDLRTNKVPPPVHIEQITANEKTYAPGRVLALPPRVRDLSIRYTALSFVAPERVHFRFKLEPQDQDWREVVNVRAVDYSNLPPGNYLFRVIASNNSGVWNETGDTLEFSIARAYYQTSWFQALCMIACVAVFWGLHKLRLHQMAREFNANLQGRVDERLRIARDLHDTLLQNFHGLLLRFQAVYNLLPGRAADARQVLETAIDDAAEALTQARDAVQGLREPTMVTNDLEKAVEALGAELAAEQRSANGDATGFSVEVEGAPRDLHLIVRDEIYRITGEAVRNAFHHARARRIEVEIRYGQQLRVRVRDDGIGIDPNVASQEGRAGHFGLPGMRERSKRIGGQLEVWSEHGAGTEVELTIPASIAYGSHASRRFGLFRSKVGTNS
ncbi:MAG TPA: two-component regulator propeller domain-containing protein, partial [Bryobacteraceae bacterium]|nr:two-component regulator propeller domain-containing protein [Bryobacteraceae bacterium]